MKLSLKTAFIAGLSLLALSQFTAYAQAQAPTPNAPAAPAPGAEVPNRVNGAVSAVTATTITIHDRRTDSDIPVAVTPDTVYLKTVTGSVTEIAAGDIVMAGGREELAAGATSLDAARINILPELPKVNRPNPRGIIGTVVTATPSLTVKTADGTTYTVNTTAATQVTSVVPGTLTDVVVGSFVQAEGKSDGTTLTAKRVTLLPARRPRPQNAQ